MKISTKIPVRSKSGIPSNKEGSSSEVSVYREVTKLGPWSVEVRVHGGSESRGLEDLPVLANERSKFPH